MNRRIVNMSIRLPNQDLGATPKVVAIVAIVDIGVPFGGHPDQVIAAPAASSVTRLTISCWSEGMVIEGSAASAVCLTEWSVALYPTRLARTVGVVSAPSAFASRRKR